MNTKLLGTYILAFSLGVTGVLVWMGIFNSEPDAPVSQFVNESEAETRNSATDSSIAVRSTARFGEREYSNERTGDIHQQLSPEDFDGWLDSLSNDSKRHAQALVMAGMITGDVDFIRQGIEKDPDNSKLLFYGASYSGLKPEEQLAYAERWMKNAPENAMAAYMYAAQLMKTGDKQKAIETLLNARDLKKIDTYMNSSFLMMEEAYLGAGYSAGEAKMFGTISLPLPHFMETGELLKSLAVEAENLPADEAADVRSTMADMGLRFADMDQPQSLIHQLMGLGIEKRSMEGLPDNAPSPYEGMTVGEVRELIEKEQEELRSVSQLIPANYEQLLMTDEALRDQYVDRVRLIGEVDAIKWLNNAIEARGE